MAPHIARASSYRRDESKPEGATHFMMDLSLLWLLSKRQHTVVSSGGVGDEDRKPGLDDSRQKRMCLGHWGLKEHSQKLAYASRRPGKQDQEFKVSLGCILSLRAAWDT